MPAPRRPPEEAIAEAMEATWRTVIEDVVDTAYELAVIESLYPEPGCNIAPNDRIR